MNSNELERTLIAACLTHHEDFLDAVAKGVRSQMFKDPVMGKAWAVMVSFLARDAKPDYISVASQMGESMAIIIELGNNPPLSGNGSLFAATLLDRARDEELLELMQRASASIRRKHMDVGFDAPEITDKALEPVFNFMHQSSGGEIEQNASDVLLELEKEWEHESKHGSKDFFVETGYRSVDYVTGGIIKGAMWTIAAMTGQGKTTYGVNLAVNAALAGHKVLYANIEMKNREIIERVISSLGQVEYLRITKRILEDKEMDGFYKTQKELFRKNLFLMHTKKSDIKKISHRVRVAKATRPFDLVVLDYIQQFRMGDDDSRKVYDHVREVSSYIKRVIASDLNCAVVCLAQMNRNAEAEKDGGMRLGNIADSSLIEKDSDFVALLMKQNSDTPAKDHTRLAGEGENLYWLQIAKNRKGPSNIKIPLIFDNAHSQFKELDNNKNNILSDI